MSWFFDFVPYILAIGTILLGAFEIVKDWKEYKTSWLRISVFVVFIVVAALSIASLRHDNQEKKDAKLKADGEMKTLQGKVDTANQAQKDNTKLFVDSFKEMSGKVSELKSEVKTEALQKKLEAVQTELQKSMAPPKAELSLTFVPYYNPPSPQMPTLTKEVTLPLQSDGSVHVEFAILNLTKVDAIDTEADFYICDECKYAKETPLFTKIANVRDVIRLLVIQDLHALQSTQTLSLDIVPPPTGNAFTIGFSYRCRTCVLHVGITPEAGGTVHVARP
jgi:hypothetical protein